MHRRSAVGCAYQKNASNLVCKLIFYDRVTKSINELSDTDAGDNASGKKVEKTADIIWENFLRFVKVLDLHVEGEPPIVVRDVLTQENVKKMCNVFETQRNSEENWFAVSSIKIYGRVFRDLGSVFLPQEFHEQWKRMVRHRIGDAIHTRKQKGDVDRESAAANATVRHPPSTYLDLLHKRKKFQEATDETEKKHLAQDWPPAHWDASVVESQRILLARRKAILQFDFLCLISCFIFLCFCETCERACDMFQLWD